MSNVSIACLSALPAEILHRIFHNLDALTILSSLRITCRRLKAIADSYDRYQLDFRHVSRSDFRLLCRLVDPQRVTSLILALREETTDQLELFTSYFHTRQFKCLRSLTLADINEKQLNILFDRFDCSGLTSFSFSLGLKDDRHEKTTVALLSSIIAQPNLNHLEIDIMGERFDKITWPTQSSIKSVKLIDCFDLNTILTVLRCSPHLQILYASSVHMINETSTRQNLCSTSFPQVISLALQDVSLPISILELFLSLMPSLHHLKLVNANECMDGNRWEQFIQTQLPLLNRFDLFTQDYHDEDTPMDAKSILASFQTPFWLEHKKWFFTWEFSKRWEYNILFYSLPICTTFFHYIPKSMKGSLSTSNSLLSENLASMDNVNRIQLSSTDFTLDDIRQSPNVSIASIFFSEYDLSSPSFLLQAEQMSSDVIFRKVTTLNLSDFTYEIPNWNRFISTIVDLKTITEIVLAGTAVRTLSSVIANLRILFQQTFNLISLDIWYEAGSMQSILTAREICALTPSHVKHLAASIKDLNEAKIILQQFRNLSTARFLSYSSRSIPGSFIEWLEENLPDSSHVQSHYHTLIWLGHSDDQSTAVTKRNKRIKLAGE